MIFVGAASIGKGIGFVYPINFDAGMDMPGIWQDRINAVRIILGMTGDKDFAKNNFLGKLLNLF
ncbi:MAG: hypothetical protein CVV06_04295 [Gammaproteobacteria bacterium HGW-Gammaproteobacteria-10]|nr:MAG: hypothetical protein CVV06_04295 [Gammaproteobacteria bacterium HGW-Gammaproteobacteria-10]